MTAMSRCSHRSNVRLEMVRTGARLPIGKGGGGWDGWFYFWWRREFQFRRPVRTSIRMNSRTREGRRILVEPLQFSNELYSMESRRGAPLKKWWPTFASCVVLSGENHSLSHIGFRKSRVCKAKLPPSLLILARSAKKDFKVYPTVGNAMSSQGISDSVNSFTSRLSVPA